MPVQTTYPGVYIQEQPSGVHTIVGVSPSVTAFVGAAGRGPVDEAVPITSVNDYLRVFGPPLDEARPMGHAVAHFFANGGSQAVVVRAAAGDAVAAHLDLSDAVPGTVMTLTASGKGSWANWTGALGMQVEVAYDNISNPDDLFRLVIAYWVVDPRTNQPVKADEETYLNLSMSPAHPRYVASALGTSRLASVTVPAGLAAGPPGTSTSGAAIATPVTAGPSARNLNVSVDFGPSIPVTLFPTATTDGPKGVAALATELTAALATAGLDSKVAVSATATKITLTSASATLDSAVTVMPGDSADISQALVLGRAAGGQEVSGSAPRRPAPVAPGAAVGRFAGGNDGSAVGPTDIVPNGGSTGVFALAGLRFPRFNILCLPGVTSDDAGPIGLALAYCKGERAILIVDSPAAGFAAMPPSLGAIAGGPTEHGALYYPRLSVTEAVPGGVRTRNIPACGAVAGVMARIDTSRGVWKAPAGVEAGITGISGLAVPIGGGPIDDNLSGALNPHGINVLRSFPAAGVVVWGARTLRGDDALSSDFKYIPVRRLTDYIASSLYIGTGFAVFEPNDPTLWGQLRLAVGTFMRGLFRQGAFQQSEQRTESASFFVTCDSTVNPQSEIDLGRVNVVVGFAPLKPAEFVVITITQISQLEA